jgi:hypothetical protein
MATHVAPLKESPITFWMAMSRGRGEEGREKE